jgi:hypothetical protein
MGVRHWIVTPPIPTSERMRSCPFQLVVYRYDGVVGSRSLAYALPPEEHNQPRTLSIEEFYPPLEERTWTDAPFFEVEAWFADETGSLEERVKLVPAEIKP